MTVDLHRNRNCNVLSYYLYPIIALTYTNLFYSFVLFLKDNNIIYSTPALSEKGMLFFASDKNVYALEMLTGSFIWKYMAGISFFGTNIFSFSN